MFVPIWLVLPWCEATNLGVFDPCHFALLKRSCATSGVFGARREAQDSMNREKRPKIQRTEKHTIQFLWLQAHPPVTGVLKWEILESALGSAPEGVPGNRGAPGGAPESAREIGGAPGSAPGGAQCGASTERALSGALPGAPPICLSTLGSTPQSTPISRSTLGSTSESTFKELPL